MIRELLSKGARAKHYAHSVAPNRLPWLLRFRAMAGDAIAAAILSSSAPWWVQKIPLLEVPPEFVPWVSVWIASLGGAVFVILWTLRRFYLKDSSLRVAPLFELMLFYRYLLQDEEKMDIIRRDDFLVDSVCNEACSRIADVFDALTGSSDVCCSIRLNMGDSDSPYFITRGRSSRTTVSREVYSVPVTASSRILVSLTEPDVLVNDVWVIPDIAQAVKDGVISKDYNLRNVDGLTGSMLVARLNYYLPSADGAADLMYGIIYFMSPIVGTFDERHVDYMKVVSCATSTILTEVLKSSASDIPVDPDDSADMGIEYEAE